MSGHLPKVATGPTLFEREIGRQRQIQLDEQVLEVAVPMRDGVELAADLYLPPATELPAPVIVTMTPYDKSSAGRLDPDGLLFRRHGYAVLVVDCRGRGKSEGVWTPAVHDAADGYDTVAWAAAAGWSNGKVGLTGHSYAGWVAWAAASQRPPGLVCMISSSPIGAWQQEMPYDNGVLQLYCAWWLHGVRRRIQQPPPEHTLIDWEQVLRTLPVRDIRAQLGIPEALWNAVMEQPLLRDGWEGTRFAQGVYDAIDVPCLHVSGWFDTEDLVGAFHHYDHMVRRPGPERAPQHLIVGPWNHPMVRWPHSDHAEYEYGPDSAVDMNAVHVAWFDRWLKPASEVGPLADVEQERSPLVQVYETGSDRWLHAARWPLATECLTLALASQSGPGPAVRGLLVDKAPEVAVPPSPDLSFRYDPLDPVLTGPQVYSYGVEDIPLDQTETELRPDVLTYTTAPLAAPVRLSGRAVLHLEAASDCDDTDWHVKLTDVDRHGRSLKVARACLRASHRGLEADPRPITPRQFDTYTLELWPAQHVFRAGHRIRISITSSDFPWAARNLNTYGPITEQDEPRVATNTIRHRGVSRLELPVQSRMEPVDD